MKKIIIDLYDDGEIKIETDGFVGKSCTENKDVQFIKDLLGEETARELKPTYWQKETEKTCTRIKHLPLCG